MGFDKVHNVSQIQLSVILMARFIMVIIYTQIILNPCRTIIKNTLSKDLSLMKTTHCLMRNPGKLLQIIADLFDCPGKASKTINIMARYCS